MSRIVKGYWDCTYCGKIGIDGLADVCPACGKPKSANIRYYMNKDVIEVTDMELEKVGMKRENCDGNHKDWICPKCNTLNKYSCNNCILCGTSKLEATYEYGYEKIDKTLNNDIPEYNSKMDNEQRIDWQFIGMILAIAIVAILGIFSIIYLFMPITKYITVDGFSWNRNIIIEEERTVCEHDWIVPYGGRVYDTAWEISGYEQVFDHYETQYESRSEQVLDHYETHYDYVDNGDGTFTEYPYDVPVYRTEYYDEPYDVPIYRDEPVYDIMYYYEIDRWFDVYTSESYGTDKNPYWNEDYILGEYERDTKRLEYYYVHYDDGSENSVDYNKWLNMQIGDNYKIVKNRLGIIYSQTQLD